MAEKKNYYEILGVSKTASDDEIKAAYKKLVKQYHPDLHPNDPAAAEKFKEINEANEVLSDKQKRAAYDYEQEHPGMGGMGGMGGGGFGGFGGFGDIFDSIFQGFGGGGGNVQRDTRGDNIEYTLSISFMDAAKGCTREITYSRNEPCPSCKGTGARNGTAFKTCQKCGGKGQVRFTQDTMFGRTVRIGVCPDCNGNGKTITEKCPDCKGKGYTRRDTNLTVNIPAGADTGSYIVKRGYGQASTQGGQAGDLIIMFRVEPHKLFERKKMDLYVDLPIPYKTAILGGKVRIPDLDDSFEYAIPEGTQSGDTFTVRGKGIRSSRGSGNLYVRAFVEVPTRLTREQKKQMQNGEAEFDIRQYEKCKRYADTMSSLYGKDPYKV